MMFDFTLNSYTTIFAIFAAIFGMAYPLLLSSIQHIDEKYKSSLMARRFREEWSYKAFQVQLILFIIATIIVPYLISWVNRPIFVYVIISIMFFALALLMANTVYLYKITKSYYDPLELNNVLKNIKGSKGALAQFDLAKYASNTGDMEVYFKSMTCVFEYFSLEKSEVKKFEPVEYSTDLKSILRATSLVVGSENRTDFLHDYNDIVSIIYDPTSQTTISESTYLLMWEMVNRAANANNFNWFVQYWTYADQYYRFFNNEIPKGENSTPSKRFYEMHFMVGALLVYLKKTMWLEHIMNFSQSIPPKFELIPSTMSQINAQAYQLSAKSIDLWKKYGKYTFIRLEKGARNEDFVVSYAYRYLALLFIRLWSFKNYNINYQNPLSLPIPNNESIEFNKRSISAWKQIRKYVEEWMGNPEIANFHFQNLPPIVDVINKIDEYIDSLKNKNEEIFAREDLDEDKLKNIADEIVRSNYVSGNNIPDSHISNLTDASNSTDIEVSFKKDIGKEFVIKGTNRELGNVGSGIVTGLDFNVRSAYLDFLLHNLTLTPINASEKYIDVSLSKQNLDNSKIIITWGNTISNPNLIRKFDNHNGIYSYKGAQIFDLGFVSQAHSGCIIVDKAELPYGEVVENRNIGPNMGLIDEQNYVYSNIYNLRPPYIIDTCQIVRIHYNTYTRGIRISIKKII